MKDCFLLLPSDSSKKNNSRTLDLNDKIKKLKKKYFPKNMKFCKMCVNEICANLILILFYKIRIFFPTKNINI